MCVSSHQTSSQSQYPCGSVFALLFLSCPYLWSRLPPSSSSPLSLPLFSQTFLCFCPSSFPPQENRAPLRPGSTNIREACFFTHCYLTKCGQACVCVCLCVHCSFIAFQAYHGNAVHFKAPYRPLKAELAPSTLVSDNFPHHFH